VSLTEEQRLASLDNLELMLTPPEERFDRITRLARAMFDVPIAEINLIGESVQFTKSPQAPGVETVSERSQSFCDITIQSPDTLVVPDATKDDRFASRTTVTGERHIRFYAGQPLTVSGGSRVGTLCLVDTEPRQFDEGQQHLLGEMALWVERELQERADRDHAGLVQQRLLPASPLVLGNCTVAGANIPFHHVGGDFYSWRARGGTVDISIADVMGKGVGAAIVAATLRATALAHDIESPADALRTINDRLLGDFSATETFATMFEARLHAETGRLDYADAGHGLSIVLRRDGSYERLSSTGLPLGIAGDVQFVTGTAQLSGGDTLVTFTDGLLDMLDGTLASVDVVADLVRDSADAHAIVQRIVALCRSSTPTDDVTVVAVSMGGRD
jgi:sigma-B regulation protein RsbU (phosphoserine phosphatase)